MDVIFHQKLPSPLADSTASRHLNSGSVDRPAITLPSKPAGICATLLQHERT